MASTCCRLTSSLLHLTCPVCLPRLAGGSGEPRAPQSCSRPQPAPRTTRSPRPAAKSACRSSPGRPRPGARDESPDPGPPVVPPCPRRSTDETWNPEGLAQVGQADSSGGIIGGAGSVLPVPLRHKLLSRQTCGLWCLAGVPCNYLNGAGGRGSKYGLGTACRAKVEAPEPSQPTARQLSGETPESCSPCQTPHLAVLLFAVSLGFCPPQPYREPEPSVAEPPSCPMVLDMSLRDSSYGVAPGPCVVAQLPSEDMSRLAEPQSRDHGFLRTKMKVLSLIPSLRTGSVSIDLCLAHQTGCSETQAEAGLGSGPGFLPRSGPSRAQVGAEKKKSRSKATVSYFGKKQQGLRDISPLGVRSRSCFGLFLALKGTTSLQALGKVGDRSPAPPLLLASPPCCAAPRVNSGVHLVVHCPLRQVPCSFPLPQCATSVPFGL